MQSSTTARAERNSRPAAGRIGPAPEQPLPPGVELPGWQKQMAALMFLRDSKAFVGQQVQRVGPMFTVRALGSPTVVVTGHENIEWLLTAGMECVTWSSGPGSDPSSGSREYAGSPSRWPAI